MKFAPRLVLFLLSLTFFSSASPVRAASLTKTKGSAVTTVTAATYHENGTISLESAQEGTLAHLGAFSGHFSYVAIPSPALLLITGTGTLDFSSGDQLFLSATIIELGLGYPYQLIGTLTVTGGTGQFQGATGSFFINGRDDESPVDFIKIDGAVLTRTRLKK